MIYNEMFFEGDIQILCMVVEPNFIVPISCLLTYCFLKLQRCVYLNISLTPPLNPRIFCTVCWNLVGSLTSYSCRQGH